ncbi:hypothetical protein [Desulfotruncus arcticus]|nr:hypothetical protein [Desulfotruncus arcticus]
MAAVWVLAGLFAGWLVLVIRQVWKETQRNGKKSNAGCSRTAGARLVAILLKDRVGQVEWFVRRVADGLERRPELRVVLIDGGSKDGTTQVLERLARQFNLGFRRLTEFHAGCPRADGDAVNERQITCWSKNCLETGRRLNYVNLPAVCIDLRGASASELLRYNLRLVG